MFFFGLLDMIGLRDQRMCWPRHKYARSEHPSMTFQVLGSAVIFAGRHEIYYIPFNPDIVCHTGSLCPSSLCVRGLIERTSLLRLYTKKTVKSYSELLVARILFDSPYSIPEIY